MNPFEDLARGETNPFRPGFAKSSQLELSNDPFELVRRKLQDAEPPKAVNAPASAVISQQSNGRSSPLPLPRRSTPSPAHDTPVPVTAAIGLPPSRTPTPPIPTSAPVAVPQPGQSTLPKPRSAKTDPVPAVASPLRVLRGNTSSLELPPWIINHTDKGSSVIRVFFSSPFGGMEEERTLLTKLYFPELRSMCNTVGLQFVPIDLRWGITESDAKDAQVLQLCLKEIERSDLFVGFYGARYGWHDVEGAPDALLTRNYEVAAQEYPWVFDYRWQSVTELEFIAGHFRCLGEKASSFYFRDPAFDASKQAELKAAGDSGERKFRAESEHAANLLDKLKTQVIESGSQCKVRLSDYKTPEEAAKLMFEDLKEKLKPRLALAAMERKQRHGDSEGGQHEVFARLRGDGFLGGDAYMAELDAFASNTGNVPMIVVGDHGTGKTSMLCRWLATSATVAASTVSYHFVGCTSKSTTLINLLQRVVAALATATKQTVDVKELDLAQLMTKFNQLAEEAHDLEKRVVLVIDAVDELQSDDHRAQELTWIPAIVGSQLKIVVSMVPNVEQLEYIQRHQWQTMELKNLLPVTLEQIMAQQLSIRGKALSDSQQSKIMATQACKNPLFLIVLITELCSFGEFEKLDAKIDECLGAPSTKALFEIVLKRLNEDFAGLKLPSGDPSVEAVMVSLCCARHGLSEDDLQGALDLAQATWSRLYFGMEELLVTRSGLLCLRRVQLRDAIMSHYKVDDTKRCHYQQRMARYFQAKLDGGQASLQLIAELPWLYQQLNASDNLRACLTQDIIFKALCTELAIGNYDLLNYWRSVGDSPEQIVGTYMQAIEAQIKECQGDKEQLADVANTSVRIGEYLAEAGHYSEAMQPFQKALVLSEYAYGKDSVRSATILGNLARLCSAQGDVNNAKVLYQRALDTTVSQLGPDDLRVANLKVSLASTLRQEPEQQFEALELLEDALKVYHAKLSSDHADVAMVLHLMGEILHQQAVLDAALSYLEQALTIRERALGVKHATTAVTLQRLAEVLMEMGRLPDAMASAQRALDIRQAAFGPDHPETAESLGKLATLHAANNDIKTAVTLYAQALASLEKTFGSDHLALCEFLDKTAELAQVEERFEQAQKLYLRSATIKSSNLGSNSPALCDGLFNLAQICMELGQTTEAYQYISRVTRIANAHYGPDHPLTQDASEKEELLLSLLEEENQ